MVHERAEQEWISYCLTGLSAYALATETATATPATNGSFHSVAEKRLSEVEGFIDLAGANYSVKLSMLSASSLFSFQLLCISAFLYDNHRFWSINFNLRPRDVALIYDTLEPIGFFHQCNKCCSCRKCTLHDDETIGWGTMKGNERKAKWKRDVLHMIKICLYDHGIFFSIVAVY